ncbi:MAG TPA: hypothetical protein VN615_17385 [Gaiellales bacterium]|nr:hypothetical protein [Gaiellales bacterium]
MKVTAVVDESGQVVASMQAHHSDQRALTGLGGKQALEVPEANVALVVIPGHTVHEITVPDDLANVSDADEFHRRLAEHVASS